MEIDYDYLRTGTAVGFRASRELCSNYLFTFVYPVNFTLGRDTKSELLESFRGAMLTFTRQSRTVKYRFKAVPESSAIYSIIVTELTCHDNDGELQTVDTP